MSKKTSKVWSPATNLYLLFSLKSFVLSITLLYSEVGLYSIKVLPKSSINFKSSLVLSGKYSKTLPWVDKSPKDLIFESPPIPTNVPPVILALPSYLIAEFSLFKLSTKVSPPSI